MSFLKFVLLLFNLLGLINSLWLVDGVLHTCAGGISPSNVLTFDISQCATDNPTSLPVKIWYYNAVNMDPVFIDPPSMVRSILVLDTTIFGVYYVLLLLHLILFNGFISTRFLSIEMYILTLLSLFQASIASFYLFWHSYAIVSVNYWFGVFLPTLPWVIFPLIIATQYY